jgi:N-acyl amino acid synthase FeeM
VLRSNDICIAVNPRHAAFYRKAFYFHDFGSLKRYGKVNGAPALALRLDCDLLRTFVSELREGRSVPSEVYSFLYRKANADQALARLGQEAEQASPLEYLSYFFSGHEAWAKASLADRTHLLESYRTLAALQASPDLFETLQLCNVINYGDRLGLALA